MTITQTATISGIEDALRECGVTETTLTPEEKDALDRQGYLVVPDLIAADWLARLRTAFEAAISQRQPTTNSQPGGKQTGTRHIGDLAGTDTAFDNVYTHPKVLAAVYHILQRPFKVFHLSGRDPLPGYGQQGLHTDWLPRRPSEPFSVVTIIWLLDDFTSNNGATRLIPGSHLMLNPLPKPLQQPESRHPDQRLIVARAGSVLVFNGHLWHSGTRNEASRPRRVLQCQFVARDAVRPTETRPDIPERLAPAARYILGL